MKSELKKKMGEVDKLVEKDIDDLENYFFGEQFRLG
jgi:hypothetical protein